MEEVVKNPITYNADGTASWTQRKGDKYVATGVDVRGHRIKPVISTSWIHISGINLFRGNKWLERAGKRFKICEVYN